MMNKTEKILFDAVKNENDKIACNIVSLFATLDKETEPDIEVPNLNLCDEHGLTLLHYAMKRCLRMTVICLLKKGAQLLPFETEEDTEEDTFDVKQNISLTYGQIKINFEKKMGSEEWLLDVINNKISLCSMIFSSKESISQIHKYLQEDNVEDLTCYLKGKGFIAERICDYLEEETADMYRLSPN